jgi:hypothetical protein
VDGEVDVAAEEGEFEFLGKEPLAAECMERPVLQQIAGGGDGDQLNSAGDGGFEGVGDKGGLKARQQAAAGSQPEKRWSGAGEGRSGGLRKGRG